jgi:hypothetical protein
MTVLSNVATSMGLSSGKTSGEAESDYYNKLCSAVNLIKTLCSDDPFSFPIFWPLNLIASGHNRKMNDELTSKEYK